MQTPFYSSVNPGVGIRDLSAVPATIPLPRLGQIPSSLHPQALSRWLLQLGNTLLSPSIKSQQRQLNRARLHLKDKVLEKTSPPPPPVESTPKPPYSSSACPARDFKWRHHLPCVTPPFMHPDAGESPRRRDSLGVRTCWGFPDCHRALIVEGIQWSHHRAHGQGEGLGRAAALICCRRSWLWGRLTLGAQPRASFFPWSPCKRGLQLIDPIWRGRSWGELGTRCQDALGLLQALGEIPILPTRYFTSCSISLLLSHPSPQRFKCYTWETPISWVHLIYLYSNTQRQTALELQPLYPSPTRYPKPSDRLLQQPTLLYHAIGHRPPIRPLQIHAKHPLMEMSPC